MCNVILYVWTHRESDSKLASEWHSEQAWERANFIAQITIADPRNNEITIADRCRNNNHFIRNSDATIKNNDRTIKTVMGRREFMQILSLHKKFASGPEFKIWKTIFFNVEKKTFKKLFSNF